MQQPNSDLTGQILIAMPGMSDPRFAHSIVYMCSHSDEGSMGLILNKPSGDVRFVELLKRLGLDAGPRARDIRVHFGGPVENGRGFVLHSTDYQADAGTIQVDDDFAMTATMDVLEKISAGDGPAKCMFALGYAGWGPLQLENEIAQNGWLTCPASDTLLFGRAHEHKWSAALKSIGVDPLSLSATAGRA